MAKLLIFLLLVATAVAVLSAPTQDEYSLHHEDNGSQLDRGEVHLPHIACGIFNGYNIATFACMTFCQTLNQTLGHCDNDECICN